MTSHLEDITATRKRLKLTVPADKIAAARQKAIKKIAGSARLQGFRPGKAPESVVVKMYPGAVDEELRQFALNDAFNEAAKERKLELFGFVQTESFEMGSDGSAQACVLVDLQPVFELIDYSSIEVPLPSEEVLQADINAAIERIVQKQTEYNVSEGAAQEGDFVKLAYTSTLEGKPIAEVAPQAALYANQDNTWEKAGTPSGSDPVIAVQFNEALVGLKAGDTKEVSFTFPQAMPSEAAAPLAGKKATYSLTIKEVRTPVKPALDDAFAKKLGLKDFAELTSKVSAMLAEEKKNARAQQKLNYVSEKLLEHDFEVPELAVVDSMRETLSSATQRLKAQGVSEAVIKGQSQAMIESAKPVAHKKAKLNFILQKIAQKEGVALTNQDIGVFLQHYAKTNNIQEADLVRMIKGNQDFVRMMRLQALAGKTLQHIASKMKETALAS